MVLIIGASSEQEFAQANFRSISPHPLTNDQKHNSLSILPNAKKDP